MPVKAGIISVSRSAYDFRSDDEPADLIDFTMRGKRGAVLAKDVVDRRGAASLWRKLGALLGKGLELEDAIRADERKKIATWLRHVDRLDEMAGSRAAMPEHNPLWDAAQRIEELES